MTMRVTDYGWNGLGEPLVTEAGSEIHDNFFRNVDGTFARVQEITADDQAAYQELLDAILTVLEEEEAVRGGPATQTLNLDPAP